MFLDPNRAAKDQATANQVGCFGFIVEAFSPTMSVKTSHQWRFLSFHVSFSRMRHVCRPFMIVVSNTPSNYIWDEKTGAVDCVYLAAGH